MTSPEEAVVSLLQPLGYQTGDCGYCKSSETGQRTPESRASYYVTSKLLHPQHYQELMDRGWRRSGTLLYLPDLARSCCPHYTIRLPASEFQPSRDQRQALNKWNRFILGEQYIKDLAIRYPKTKEQKKQANNTFDLVQSIHECESANTKPDLKKNHSLEVTLEPDTFTEEKFQLFKDYQQNVHHESSGEITRAGFKRFLCSSPVQRTNRSGQQLGSFHQCYRLDGQLIAMGVLDLLPHAISGVYFIYHHDFEKWSMGKLSALREAALAGEAGYDYYYMGYYIHDCAKMKYKGTYKQQYVLDCADFAWKPLDDSMRSLMDKGSIANVAQGQAPPWTFPGPTEAVESGRSLLDIRMPGVMTLTEFQAEVDLDDIRVLLGQGRLHRVSDLVSWKDSSVLESSTLKGVIAEYAACVGPLVAHEAIVDLSR